MEITNPNQIERMIYVIRGQKVMLDSDLAELYEIPTGRMNEQVKREGRGGRRKMPLVFTECGVAMLSSVLSSSRAISVNITIMRTFVRLRSFLAMETTFSEKVGRIEKSTNHLFKVVFERLDALEEGLPTHPKDRKKIGLTSGNN